MKIIHFINSIDKSSGGTSAYMQLLSNHLKKEIIQIVITKKQENPLDFHQATINYFDLSIHHLSSLNKRFSEFIISEMPDIVHINGIWNPQNWLIQKAAQKVNIPVVLTPHGMLEPYILNRNPIKKKIALKLYQHKAIKSADYIHATALSELSQIHKLGYHQKATIIANGIDTSAILEKKAWKTNEKFNILFLSRVHPKKGIEFLIKAISYLHKDKVIVQIAGEGEPEYINYLKRLCKDYQVQNNFEFIGGIYGQKKWELFNKADLFVLPTYSENFGIVVAEALATGVPVITTKGTPWEELVTHNCGWWIDLTIENLTKSINEAYSMSPEELRSLGENGKKLVRKKYDIKTIAQTFEQFYSYILNPNEKYDLIK